MGKSPWRGHGKHEEGGTWASKADGALGVALPLPYLLLLLPGGRVCPRVTGLWGKHRPGSGVGRMSKLGVTDSCRGRIGQRRRHVAGAVSSDGRTDEGWIGGHCHLPVLMAPSSSWPGDKGITGQLSDTPLSPRCAWLQPSGRWSDDQGTPGAGPTCSSHGLVSPRGSMAFGRRAPGL